MKVVPLVSGGKDTYFAMMRCVDYGHEVGHQILVNYAECMGLPLFRRRIHGSMRATGTGSTHDGTSFRRASEQALMNSEAVANSFNASLASSSIFLVVYCAAALTLRERTQIQHKMESFLQNRNLQQSKRMHNPVSLYILAPALPKGALVEVKPILHVPANIDDEAGNHSPQPTGKTATCYFHFVDCCSSCYQIYTVSGKICMALVSVTKDLATKICFNDKSQLSPVGQMRIIIQFYIFSINNILVDCCVFWGNLMYLKFYYNTSLSLTTETLDLIFSEAFAEFAEANKSLWDMIRFSVLF